MLRCQRTRYLTPIFSELIQVDGKGFFFSFFEHLVVEWAELEGTNVPQQHKDL